jgi:hypothetical protein
MKEIPLRGKHWTFDRRLDCILDDFDPRSRRFSISDFVRSKTPTLPHSHTPTPSSPPPLRSAVWPIPGETHLDQGSTGRCVGCGITHALQAFPMPRAGLNLKTATQLYYGAQRRDNMPGGEYSFWCWPKYSGTTVLAGADEAKRQGYVSTYRWAFSLDDLLAGLAWSGGAVLGIPWSDGMENIDANGLSHPGGQSLGGHCIYAYRLTVPDSHTPTHPHSHTIISLWQSWGNRGGRNGIYHVTAADLWDLLKGYKGQACFLEGKKAA